MIGAPASPPMADRGGGLITPMRLLIVALVLGGVLLLFQIYLLVLLRSLDETARRANTRVALAESALGRAADQIESGPIQVPIQLKTELPVNTSVRLQQTLQFPINAEVPINANVELPINTPFGAFNVPVPLNVKVPVNTQVPITIDQSVPISATLPIDINRTISIDLRGTAAAAELKQVREALRAP